MSDSTTITAIVSETSSPLSPVSPWPLIYTVQVTDPNDETEIRRVVALERYAELECDNPDYDTATFNAVLEGIEVHFVFEGDVATLVDFRG